MGRLCVAAVLGAALIAMNGARAWGAGGEQPNQKNTATVGDDFAAIAGRAGDSNSFLQVGSSMLTLDMVDDTHLLLTFSSRGLVPRCRRSTG